MLGALLDPARQLQTFASLVQRAGLTGFMDSSGDAFTLFAPNEQVRRHCATGADRAAKDLRQSLSVMCGRVGGWLVGKGACTDKMLTMRQARVETRGVCSRTGLQMSQVNTVHTACHVLHHPGQHATHATVYL